MTILLVILLGNPFITSEKLVYVLHDIPQPEISREYVHVTFVDGKHRFETQVPMINYIMPEVRFQRNTSGHITHFLLNYKRGNPYRGGVPEYRLYEPIERETLLRPISNINKVIVIPRF